jgi:hypothetical protein
MSKNFIKTTLLTSALLMLLISGFNYLIDPYDIYQADLVDLKKHVAFKTLRMHKAHAVSRLKPKTIIIGSSRTHQGFNPDMEILPYKPAYNLGLVRSNVHEIYRYVQHTAAQNNLKQLFITLDLFSFNAMLRPRGDFDERRLSMTIDGYNQDTTTADFLSSLLSFSALKASFNTIADRNTTDKPLTDRNGLHNQLALSNEIMKQGHRKSTRKIEDQFAGAILFPEPAKQFRFRKNKDDATATAFDIFRDLINFCHEKNIDTYIALNPTHARMFEVFYQRGLWNEFEEWKRNITRINAEVASTRNVDAFPLWDFAAHNSVTMDHMPSSEEKKMEARYFWEATHFKINVGELMIRKMLNYKNKDQIEPVDFGVLLNEKNLDQHLMVIRKAREDYAQTHAEDLKDLLASMKEINEQFVEQEKRKTVRQ